MGGGGGEGGYSGGLHVARKGVQFYGKIHLNQIPLVGQSRCSLADEFITGF